MSKSVSQGLIYYIYMCFALLIVISVAQSPAPDGYHIEPCSIEIDVSPESLEVNRTESFEFNYNISVSGGPKDESKSIIIRIPNEFDDVSILSNYDYDATNRSITIEYVGVDIAENMVVTANIPKNATLGLFEFDPCDRRYLICPQSPCHDPTCNKTITINITNNKPRIVDSYNVTDANNKTIKPGNDKCYKFIQNHIYYFICTTSDKDGDILDWVLYEDNLSINDNHINSSQELHIPYNASKIGSYNLKIRFSDGIDYDEIGPILVLTSKGPINKHVIYLVSITIICFILDYIMRRVSNKTYLALIVICVVFWVSLVILGGSIRSVLRYELSFYLILLLYNLWFIRTAFPKNHEFLIQIPFTIVFVIVMLLLITYIPCISRPTCGIFITILSIFSICVSPNEHGKENKEYGNAFKNIILLFGLYVTMAVGYLLVGPTLITDLNNTVNSLSMGISIISFEYMSLMITPLIIYSIALFLLER